jgi:hypothetical protein
MVGRNCNVSIERLMVGTDFSVSTELLMGTNCNVSVELTMVGIVCNVSAVMLMVGID